MSGPGTPGKRRLRGRVTCAPRSSTGHRPGGGAHARAALIFSLKRVNERETRSVCVRIWPVSDLLFNLGRLVLACTQFQRSLK